VLTFETSLVNNWFVNGASRYCLSSLMSEHDESASLLNDGKVL
jgi:hypothetical protein